METPPLDHHGLFFAVKTIVGIGLLAVVTHLGAGYAVAKLYPTPEAEKEINQSTVLSEEMDREPTEALQMAENVSKGDEGAIPAEGKFISADLLEMTLTLYENGLKLKSFPVVSKGKPGSHWETPTGRYTINSKTPDHFSSIGKVHMPYSMQFYGNFFIHGWPYYPDGTPVPEGFSGGCIRLSTENAKEVYAFADVDTPLYVFEVERRVSAQKLSQLAVDAGVKPKINARAYFVADIDTGDILLSKNARKRYAIASITKLMTAVVANETIAYNRTIAINGDEYALGDLYYPLFLRSSNVTAEAIASELGRKRFLNEMNAKAKALEMYATSFDDASGLSERSMSTAWDLYHLLRYVYEKKKFVLEISRTQQMTITGENGRKWTVQNHNRYSSDPMFVGGKLGYTEAALQTSASIFTVLIDGQMRNIAVIVLGTPDWKGDTKTVINWLPSHVSTVGNPFRPTTEAK